MKKEEFDKIRDVLDRKGRRLYTAKDIIDILKEFTDGERYEVTLYRTYIVDAVDENQAVDKAFEMMGETMAITHQPDLGDLLNIFSFKANNYDT